MKKLFVLFGLAIAAVYAPCATWAETISSKNDVVHVIVMASPGGSLDLMGRIIAQELPSRLDKRAAVVDNMEGANGNVALHALAHSEPDGSTIGIITNGTHGANPSLYGKGLQYDPIKDFAPISMLVRMKHVLVVNPALPVTDVKSFVEYANSHPGSVFYASSGIGSMQQLAGELFKKVTGIDVRRIQYPGTSGSLLAVANGESQAMFPPIFDAQASIRDGRVKVLGVTSKQRAVALPDMKTIAEQGYPDFDISSWVGLAAPAGTPDAIVQSYATAVRDILEAPETSKRLLAMGLESEPDTPSEFAALIHGELERWPAIVALTGAKLQ